MRWSRFVRRAAWDQERSREIESYVQMETDDNIARGMAPDAARAAALRKLGNRTHATEDVYRFNTIGALDTIARDARHGLRVLRRHPTYAIAAILTLALAVGANTAAFSVVDGVLLKPLPYPDPDALVVVQNEAPGAPGVADFAGALRLSASMFFTYAEHNTSFEHVGVWIPGNGAVTGRGEPEQVRAVAVSHGTLEALAVPPLAGRWLSASDQEQAAPLVVILGHGYWQRRFGGRPDIVGQTLTVDGLPREIVGIMPRGFAFATSEADLIAPFRFDRSRTILPGFGLLGVARLKPGVTLEQANADVARMLPIWMRSWPAAPGINPRIYEAWRITPALEPLKASVLGDLATALWVVFATLGIVMLIACANVANLQLVRADGRQQEVAVRAALGAGSWRIVREMLIESLVLALIGGAVGVALAVVAVRLVVALAPASMPRLDQVAIDARTLAFALGASLLAGLLFGIMPSLKSRRTPTANALHGSARGATGSRERARTRGALVVVQVALALVLLVSSGLMARSFVALRQVAPGFTAPERVLTASVTIPPTIEPDSAGVARMQHRIVDALAAIPGVTAAAFSSAVPMEFGAVNWDSIGVEGQTPLADDETAPFRVFKNVSPGVFATLGTRVLAGRDLTWTDVHEARPVVLVSENLAREYWGSPRAAIGRRLRQGVRAVAFSPWSEVIGVVEDVRDVGVDRPAPATVYWPPVRQFNGPQGPVLSPTRRVTLAIRSTRTGGDDFLQAVHQAVWSVNASLPLATITTLGESYARSMARTSFTLAMLAIAGGMALLLGVVGIYGVMAYAVTQHRREIGIRLALGAAPGTVRRRFVRDGMTLAALGIAIGSMASLGVSRLLTSLLYGVSALDPLTYAGVVAALTAAAAAASYLPARRASRVPPVEALAAE
jgi:predicted permease